MIVYGIISSPKRGYYKLNMCAWDDTAGRVVTHSVFKTRQGILEEIHRMNCILINASIMKNNAVYFRKYKDTMAMIKMIAMTVREIMVKEYGSGTDLAGYCIEASEILQTLYGYMGLKSHTVEGWCEFDDEYYGSDRPYDPHTWLEIPSKSDKPLYVDITADQFNHGMYTENKYPGVLLSVGLPHGMSYEEPVIYED